MALIEILNLQKREVDLEFLRKVASKLLKNEDKEISIVLVDEKKIRQLNKKFRREDKSTDVLAFPLGGEFISTRDLLGEVIISVESAQKEAKKRNHSLKEEIVLLLIHGILHLKGYDDKRKEEKELMRKKEREILISLGIREDIV
ncbi:rRNA maturation RNase YbeY [Candidatus Aerophobetes bacterium]|nr:rRNA maturation RNase YbeY [Candidatus Aerophobetes bacterium]